MKILVFKRWRDFSIRRKIGLIGGILVAGLMAFALWNLFFGEAPSSLPTQESVPVQSMPDQNIIFYAEVVKPLPQGGDYFVNYRLQREASRQEAKDMLVPLLDSNVEKAREVAQEKWLHLSHKIEKEEQIENLLKISGLQDAVADLGNNEIAVMVYAPSLNSEEIELIQDVVLRVTDKPKEQVRVSYRY